MNNLSINHAETFPNLSSAPIVEAVLHWQATSSKELNESDLLKVMHRDFPEYTSISQHNLEAVFQGPPEGLKFKQLNAWQGVRMTRKQDGKDKFVCQFLRHGVVFSQLAPYTSWQDFEPEAKKFWNKFCELGDPGSVNRLSVRFISQIGIASVDEIDNYIDTVCEPVQQLGLIANSYFHQDTIELANRPYVINIVRAVQPRSGQNSNLIVDITALTSESFELGQVDEKLEDLRFIKNKVFFTLMKDAVKSFGANCDGGN